MQKILIKRNKYMFRIVMTNMIKYRLPEKILLTLALINLYNY